MAIRDAREVRQARTVAILWALPGITGAFLIGLVALQYFGVDHFYQVMADGELKMVTDVEQAMPLLATELLPPILAGLLISGAVAAMMSTADSQLLVSTSAVTEDFVHQFLGIKLSDKSLVTLSRVTIVLLGLIAFGIAMLSEIQKQSIPKEQL
jgi:sodium/proline symporter